MMNLTFLAGMLVGMIAALMLNIGKGVQKQKVHVFLTGRRILHKENRRDLLIWLLGMGLTGGSMLPYSVGLKLTESPSTMAAMTGVGLIGLVIYALRVIGERLDRNDGIGIVLVMVGTTILAWLGGQTHDGPRTFSDGSILLAAGILGALATLGCLAALRFRRIHGVAFGIAAGITIGTALMLADLALVSAGGDLIGQFLTPYLYVVFVLAVLALVLTQLGFLRGRALEVVPSVNSAIILTPLVLEIMVYKTMPDWLRLVMIGMILIGVILLSIGKAARVNEAPVTP